MLEQLMERLKGYDGRPLKIMEVCGTHTSVIAKAGLHQAWSDKIRLVSGPGCPVCVTPTAYIDWLVDFSKQRDCCVLSFGDLLKVPGQSSSLAQAKMEGGVVDFVYSPFQAVERAVNNPDISFVFAAVGFETTAAVYAVLLEEMAKRDIRNLKLLTSIKTTIPALRFVCENESIDGYICPGHVSVIIGSKPYEQLCEKFQKPFVVAGFEGEYIVSAVTEIIRQIEQGEPAVKNYYSSSVSEEGNHRARELMDCFFESKSSFWRGLGEIPESGLYIRDEYSRFDAGSAALFEDCIPLGCRCPEVILGRITPRECGMFGKQCTPRNPVGACMVSVEGACAISFREGGL